MVCGVCTVSGSTGTGREMHGLTILRAPFFCCEAIARISLGVCVCVCVCVWRGKRVVITRVQGEILS